MIGIVNVHRLAESDQRMYTHATAPMKNINTIDHNFQLVRASLGKCLSAPDRASLGTVLAARDTNWKMMQDGITRLHRPGPQRRGQGQP